MKDESNLQNENFPKSARVPQKNDAIGLGEKYVESTLAGWHPPAKLKSVREDAELEMGWGKILFAHTFTDSQKLIKRLSAEEPGQRNIAFYLREPHVILSQAPQEIFLDPSHSYRLWLDDKKIPIEQENQADNIVITSLKTRDQCKTINEIYRKNAMVEAPPEFIYRHRHSRKIQYLIAVDKKTKQVYGSITGIDHYHIFGDSEKGSSFWCLAVDPASPLPGIGKALIAGLAKIYRKRKRTYMDLSVLHSNAEAIHFYEDLGFVRVPIFTLKYKNALNEPLYTTADADTPLNPYAEIILREARKRGIQCNILRSEPAMFELNFGGRCVVCHESLSDQTSAIALTNCRDKSLTASILKENNIRVPEQLVTKDLDKGLAFLRQYKRTVVKPLDGEQGDRVFVDLRYPIEFQEAFESVSASGDVLIEEFFEGEDTRVVVINGEVVAAAVRKAPVIAGTGKHSIRTLIQKLNRRRMAATHGESKIPMDGETERCIRDEGYTYQSILPAGKKLRVRRTANLHTGGTLEDITASLSSAIQKTAIKAAELLGIPVVGFDFMVKNGSEFCIIEANERPGLANHEPQPTAEKFIDFLFPQTITVHPPQAAPVK